MLEIRRQEVRSGWAVGHTDRQPSLVRGLLEGREATPGGSLFHAEAYELGIEAGPISWQLPVVLDRHDNQKSVSSSKRILSDQSNALDFRRQEDKDDATCFQVVDLEWSDSNLFDENYSGLNNKMKGSKNSKRSTKVRKRDYGSNNKGNPTQPANSHDDGVVYLFIASHILAHI